MTEHSSILLLTWLMYVIPSPFLVRVFIFSCQFFKRPVLLDFTINVLGISMRQNAALNKQISQDAAEIFIATMQQLPSHLSVKALF